MPKRMDIAAKTDRALLGADARALLLLVVVDLLISPSGGAAGEPAR